MRVNEKNLKNVDYILLTQIVKLDLYLYTDGHILFKYVEFLRLSVPLTPSIVFLVVLEKKTNPILSTKLHSKHRLLGQICFPRQLCIVFKNI